MCYTKNIKYNKYVLGGFMKKKFLSFVLAICLILPCAFALSACGKNPPDEPVDLAGKTIVVQYGAELDWNLNKITIAVAEEVNDNDGSSTVVYSTELTLEEFVEQFYESNPELIKDIAGNSNINNVEEAKNSIEIRMGGRILSSNPIIKFSEDGTTATTYAGNDTNLETPLKTYTVQKSGDGLITYDLYEGQEAKIRITCDSDSIDATDMFFYSGEVFTYETTIDIGYNYEQVKISLTNANDADDIQEFSLTECEFDYKPHTLTLRLNSQIICYKVK